MALIDDCQAAFTAAQTEDTEDWGLVQTQIDNNIAELDAEVVRQAGLGLQTAVIANVIEFASQKKKKGPGKKWNKKREKDLFRKFETQALEYVQTHFTDAGLTCAIERGKKLLVSGWAP